MDGRKSSTWFNLEVPSASTPFFVMMKPLLQVTPSPWPSCVKSEHAGWKIRALELVYIYIYTYVIADSLQLETSRNLGIWKNKGLYWLQPIQGPVNILIILYNTVSFNICDCIKWCSTFNIQYIHISLSKALPRFYMCLLSNYILVIYDKFTPNVWTWHNCSWSTAEAVEFVWAMKQQGTKSPLLHLTRHSVTSSQWRLFQAVDVAALHASFSGLQLSLEAQRI